MPKQRGWQRKGHTLPAALLHDLGSGFCCMSPQLPGRAAVYTREHAGRGGAPANKDKLYHCIDDIPLSTRAGAGLYTTADDLSRWIIALQSGRLLSEPASVLRLWQPDLLDDGKPNIWAMGWPILAGTTHRAVGGIGGGRSTFFVYPDDDVAVIVMTNLVGANPQNLIDTIASLYIAKGTAGSRRPLGSLPQRHQ